MHGFTSRRPWRESLKLLELPDEDRSIACPVIRIIPVSTQLLQRRGVTVLSQNNLTLTLDTHHGLPDLSSLLPPPHEAASLHPTQLAQEVLQSVKFAFCTPPDLTLAALRQRLADPTAVAAVVRERVVRLGVRRLEDELL